MITISGTVKVTVGKLETLLEQAYYAGRQSAIAEKSLFERIFGR